MNSAKADRRVRRTQELLRSALVSLIQEKGYDRITIQDILDRADVGRSTFYSHYRDKDELLLAGFEDIRLALARERDAAETGMGGKVEFLQPVLVVFQHVERHRHLWHSMSQKGGADIVVRILRRGVTDLVREHFRSHFPDAEGNQAQLEAAMQFVIGACMGLLIWWLDDEASYSAEEMHAMFQQLTTGGVNRFLAGP